MPLAMAMALAAIDTALAAVAMIPQGLVLCFMIDLQAFSLL